MKSWHVMIGLVLLLVAGQGVAQSSKTRPSPAQKPAEPAAQQPEAPASAGEVPAEQPPAAEGGADAGDIDQILEGEEQVLAGSGYTYDPGDRRDPFKSLLVAPERRELSGPRPEGIPGLLIDEIKLSGIFKTPKGFVAQVQASDKQKSYLLKEGDQLYDGDVVSISSKEVVFKQIVQDPTALKPFREVVKSLNP